MCTTAKQLICFKTTQYCCHVYKYTMMCQSNTTKLYYISVFKQLDAQNLFHNKFYFMPLHVSSICAHHQEVKIVLHMLETCRGMK